LNVRLAFTLHFPLEPAAAGRPTAQPHSAAMQPLEIA
jgi:hypothetical protein